MIDVYNSEVDRSRTRSETSHRLDDSWLIRRQRIKWSRDLKVDLNAVKRR